MQRYTVYFIWKLLYIFRVVPSPIIRSANNCIYSIWYLSHPIATCRYRGKVGTDLNVLWVAYATQTSFSIGARNVSALHRDLISILNGFCFDLSTVNSRCLKLNFHLILVPTLWMNGKEPYSFYTPSCHKQRKIKFSCRLLFLLGILLMGLKTVLFCG
jgi:hypothetical protein